MPQKSYETMCQGIVSRVIQGAVAHDHMTIHEPSIHFIPEPAFYLASGKISQRHTSLNKHCTARHALKIVELNYKPVLNRTPKIILQTTVLKKTLLSEINRFPGLSRTSSHFPGLSSPGKCHNKIPGLSRFSRTRTNPVSCNRCYRLRPIMTASP